MCQTKNSFIYLINQRVYIDIVHLICDFKYFLEQLPIQLKLFWCWSGRNSQLTNLREDRMGFLKKKTLMGLSRTCGWAAKIGPTVLSEALKDLEVSADENLLVGFETSDDGAVYRLTSEIALISTVDFITPPVDDPWWFGQIAAANSLSDVYAMGGKPLTALNLVMFPSKKLDMGLLKEIPVSYTHLTLPTTPYV